MKNKAWIGWVIFFAAVAAINLLKYKGIFDIGFWII